MRHPRLSRSFSRWIALTLIFTLAIPSFIALAQDGKDGKDGKKPKRAKDPVSAFKHWADHEVPWIITEVERRAFQSLQTDEEREQFIEQFWLRRDPNPDTEVNEYKEEYYQRVAYANENFSSGIPGSKTDRGRIYILYGQPDEKASHPSGGSYDRPAHEGGGTTSTYPFEVWWYRHLEGVGSDVEIEFVDPTGSGEYHIARGPDEKDALLYVPNAGPTLAEQLGVGSKADRIAGISRGQLFAPRMKDGQFERLELRSRLERTPQVRFSDLAAIAAESDLPKITADVLPVWLQVDKLRVTENSVMASFTVQLENQDLVYRDVGGIQQAAANIFARITSVSGRRANQFEDVVTSSYTPEALAAGLQGRSVYQQKVFLAPGTYKIDLAVRDIRSGKTGVIHQGFAIPRYPEDELAASSLVLASKLEPLNGNQSAAMFTYGSMKVVPNPTRAFKPEQTLGVYLQVYNVALDQATLRPRLEVEYVITQQNREAVRLKEDGKNSLSALNSQQVTLGRLIPLKDLKPGFYELMVKITDQVAEKTIIQKEPFQVLSPSQTSQGSR